MRHAILFLAANPSKNDRLALGEEASAIQSELERGGCRDAFELVMRWAVEPLDLLREIRRVKPTVVHLSGHGGQLGEGTRKVLASRRDVIAGNDDDVEDSGLYFRDRDGNPRLVSTAALTEALAATGAVVRLVVLDACSSNSYETTLLMHTDCVIDVIGPIQNEAARSFAVGLYGGLAERASIAAAFHQGRAAIRLAGLPDGDCFRLQARDGVNPGQVVLAPQARWYRSACKSHGARCPRGVR